MRMSAKSSDGYWENTWRPEDDALMYDLSNRRGSWWSKTENVFRVVFACVCIGFVYWCARVWGGALPVQSNFFGLGHSAYTGTDKNLLDLVKFRGSRLPPQPDCPVEFYAAATTTTTTTITAATMLRSTAMRIQYEYGLLPVTHIDKY